MNNTIPPLKLDHYFDYQEIKACLEGFHAAAPQLCSLTSIGKTHHDREILVLQITAPGQDPTHKKGIYVDACTHAEEMCGINVALKLAWELLSGYETNAQIQKLLEGVVFYILPVLTPDGMEYCLKLNQPGNGNGRYQPEEFQPGPGLHFCDINHDGRIAQMRVFDPAGEWKVSGKDPRLMVLRSPDDIHGPFYRMYPEGYIEGDTVGFPIQVPRSGNLNRNYPGKWKPEGLQYGGGELPLFEPETRAVAHFFVAHPNIALVVSLHTNAGAVMRPFFSQGDENYCGQDLKLFTELGKMGTEELGYNVLSFYEHLTPDKSKARTGALCDWTFDFLGIPSFLVEFWNVYDAAGTARPKNFHFSATSEQTDYDVLKWADEAIGPDAHLNWTPFDHPQLGKVEIGGRDRIWIERNPPASYLPDLAEKGTRFLLKLAQSLPRLRILRASATCLAPDIYKVSAVIRNSGFMPTNLTAQALSVKAAPEPSLDLQLRQGEYEMICCNHPHSIPHLEGRFGRVAEWSRDMPNWEPTECLAQWVVRTAEAAPVFQITVSGDRIGEDHCEITVTR